MKQTKGTTVFELVERKLVYDRFQNPKMVQVIESLDKVSGKKIVHEVDAMSFKEALKILVPSNRVQVQDGMV